MPQAARKGDPGQHDKPDLTAAQGSPDVFINGREAVRVGDVYTGPPHRASTGSATVNINGKPAVRVGDLLDGHAVAVSGSPDVIIGDLAYGSAQSEARPIYELVLSQVPGSGDSSLSYVEYPCKVYLNGALVHDGLSDKNGMVRFEYEPPLKGLLRVEMGSGDVTEMNLAAFDSSDTRQGLVQRMGSLGYLNHTPDGRDAERAMREVNSEELLDSVRGCTKTLKQTIKSRLP